MPFNVNKVLNKYVKGDLQRLYPGKPTFSRILKGLRAKGFKYLFFLRIAAFSNGPLYYIARFLLRILTYRYGFQISPKTTIGPGLFIGHFGTLVINPRAVIGKNCNIAHNVTVGGTFGPNSGVPFIKDEVWIGTGSVIVGNITIGPNVLIAPNSYVNFSVPENSLVMGNPAQIYPKNNPTKNYILNKVL